MATRPPGVELVADWDGQWVHIAHEQHVIANPARGTQGRLHLPPGLAWLHAQLQGCSWGAAHAEVLEMG
jgi:hypothetical protein